MDNVLCAAPPPSNVITEPKISIICAKHYNYKDAYIHYTSEEFTIHFIVQVNNLTSNARSYTSVLHCVHA